MFSLLIRYSDKFLNLRSLTNSITEIVELSSSNLTNSNNLNLSNVGRVKGECLFNADTVSHLSNGECFSDKLYYVRERVGKAAKVKELI